MPVPPAQGSKRFAWEHDPDDQQEFDPGTVDLRAFGPERAGARGIHPQVPNFITARTPSIAALSDGQALLISWYEPTSVRFRRSANGGASSGPERVALTMLTPSVDGAWFDAVYGTASVFTADGSASGIMSGVTLRTGPYDPPPGLPGAVPQYAGH